MKQLFRNTPKTEQLFQVLCTIGILLSISRAIDVGIDSNTLCQFDGCQVVERLTKLPKGVFECLGATYFASLLLVYKLQRHLAEKPLLKQLLLAGVVAEAFLVGYQLYVAHTFCVFCITIGLLILSSSLCVYKRQSLYLVAAFSSILIIMPFVTYGSLNMNIQELKTGTVARKTATQPTSEEYILIFSKTCPHCKKVLEKLETVDWATIYYNPIYPVTQDEVCISAEFSETPVECQSNRQFLTLLGEKGVPVLITKTSSTTFGIYKGDDTILRFLDQRRKILQEKKTNHFSLPNNTTPIMPQNFSFGTQNNDSCNDFKPCTDEDS